MRQKTLAVTDEPSDPMRRHRTQQANRANEPTNERLGFLPTNAGADEPRRRRACSSPNPSVFLRLLVGVAGFVGQNRRLGSSARNPGARSLVTARNPGARSSFVGHAPILVPVSSDSAELESKSHPCIQGDNDVKDCASNAKL
nr:hypothetical protein CFP56_62657 [Quercus suber]